MTNEQFLRLRIGNRVIRKGVRWFVTWRHAPGRHGDPTIIGLQTVDPHFVSRRLRRVSVSVHVGTADDEFIRECRPA